MSQTPTSPTPTSPTPVKQEPLKQGPISQIANDAVGNVVPFRRPAPRAAPKTCDVVALADDLFSVLADLNGLAERATLLGRPALEVERTVQNLLDAVTAVERAIDCVGEGSEAGEGSGAGSA